MNSASVGMNHGCVAGSHRILLVAPEPVDCDVLVCLTGETRGIDGKHILNYAFSLHKFYPAYPLKMRGADFR